MPKANTTSVKRGPSFKLFNDSELAAFVEQVRQLLGTVSNTVLELIVGRAGQNKGGPPNGHKVFETQLIPETKIDMVRAGKPVCR